MKHQYILINLVFAGIIAGILLYSGIFSPTKNNYPLVCMHQALNGNPCPTCGLSHSFSAMIRGEFKTAKLFNPNGPRIFAFFAIQLVLRLIISFWIYRKPGAEKYIWRADAAASLALLIYCFIGVLSLSY